eukprot:102724_1
MAINSVTDEKSNDNEYGRVSRVETMEISFNNEEKDKIDVISLEPTIYNLVFMRQYHKTPNEKYRWWCLSISIIMLQLFCLLVLSSLFVKTWTNDYHSNGAMYVDEGLYEKRIFILTFAPLWFFGVMTSLIVTASYLFKSLKPFVVLLSGCLHQIDNKTKKHSLKLRNYRYGIFISFVNIALILSTFALAIFIAFYGLYFKIDNPSDIVLASIGNVFILEIDDYICEWFTNSSNIYKDEFWDISVKSKEYNQTVKWVTIFFCSIAAVLPISFGFQCANTFGYHVKKYGAGSLLYVLVNFYSTIFPVGIILSLPVFVVNSKCRENCFRIVWISAFIVGLGVLTENVQLTGNILIYSIGSVVLIAIIYLDIKKYDKWCTSLFIFSQILILIIAIIERAMDNNSYLAAYTLISCVICVFIKFKGVEMFKTNRQSD